MAPARKSLSEHAMCQEDLSVGWNAPLEPWEIILAISFYKPPDLLDKLFSAT